MGAYAAPGHAAVAGLDDDGDAQRLQIVPYALGDLRGQPLLNLQAPGIAFQHPRQLRDTHNAIGGQIGDRRGAGDRRQMVLAMRLERDVPQQNHLVIASDLLEGAGEMGRGILVVPRCIFAPGAANAGGRVAQALAVGIVARPQQQGADRILHRFRH